MNPESISPQLVRLLADVFQIGSDHGTGADVVVIVRLLRRLRPALRVLAQVEAWHLVELGRVSEARDVLELDESAATADPVNKALLALCLYLQRDCLWQSYADEVRAMPDNEEALETLQLIDQSIAQKNASTEAVLY